MAAEITLDMTTANATISTWAAHPMGKVARVAIAVGGVLVAILVMMVATVVPNGAWALVALGAGIAALAVRAARVPSTARLAAVTAALVAIPLVLQVF